MIRDERGGSISDALAVQAWALQKLVGYVVQADREYAAMASANTALDSERRAQSTARFAENNPKEGQEPIDLLEHQS